MSGLVTGIVGGGAALLGAGAQVYGASQSPDGMSQHSMPVNAFYPYSDPLLSALSLNAGVGIGQFDPNMYRQASPVQQLIAQASTGGLLNKRDMRLLQSSLNYDPEVIRRGQELYRAAHPDDDEGWADSLGIAGAAVKAVGAGGDVGGTERSGSKAAKLAWQNFLAENNIDVKQFRQARRGLRTAERLAQNAGFDNLGGLFRANEEYLGKIPELEAQYKPVADQLRSGILASQGRIGQYLQDLPNLLTGDQNPFIDQLREEALITSQKYGVNPYQHLEQARSTALQRALQLVAGEQAVLGGQQQAALPVAQLRQQGGATAANVGAGQAAMLAQALQSQQAAQANQAQQWGQVGNTLGQFGLIGADMYSSAKGPGTQG